MWKGEEERSDSSTVEEVTNDMTIVHVIILKLLLRQKYLSDKYFRRRENY
jgi:hypothetical protein